MIWESAPWKEQLLRDAGKLRKLAQTKLNVDDCERELVQLERLVFMTAYSMRKLWESGKLSNNWNAARLPCVRFPLKGRVPDRLDWHYLDRHYDLNSESEVGLRPEEYCDRMIHSFVFSPIIDDNECINSFYFTSDRMRKHALWMVAVDDICGLVRRTGKDYPSSGHYVRDSGGQWITWSGHGDPPVGWTKALSTKPKGGSSRR
jgi:hypothetical protein